MASVFCVASASFFFVSFSSTGSSKGSPPPPSPKSSEFMQRRRTEPAKGAGTRGRHVIAVGAQVGHGGAQGAVLPPCAGGQHPSPAKTKDQSMRRKWLYAWVCISAADLIGVVQLLLALPLSKEHHVCARTVCWVRRRPPGSSARGRRLPRGPMMDDEELQRIYQWVDDIPLTRPKRNIARDFADGVLVAEIVGHYFPKLIEVHNYPAANSYATKMYNW